MNAQSALAECGIPAYFGTWREGAKEIVPPNQYLAHTSMTVPDAYHDDQVQMLATYAYVNLWSVGNPSAAIQTVRTAMFGAGWEMIEERNEYDASADRFLVAWTWVAREKV